MKIIDLHTPRQERLFEQILYGNAKMHFARQFKYI